MEFVTNFTIGDYEKYIKAVGMWEHGYKLEVRNVDCWGGTDRDMGSLHRSDDIRDLSPFWRIFRKLEED